MTTQNSLTDFYQTEEFKSVEFLNEIYVLPRYGSQFPGHGDNYQPLAEITKQIRKELKPLKKLGFKISVTVNSGSSISVTVKEFPENFIPFNPYYDQQKAWEINVGKVNSWEVGKDPRELYTKDGKNLLTYLEAIANQFNYNNSDLQTDYFDVNFFLTVDYHWKLRP